MSVARQCKDLFRRTDNIGEGVAALGDMLRWAPEDDIRHTLAGLGEVLRTLGANIQAVSEEYSDTSYNRIVELEESEKDESRIYTALEELRARAAARKTLKEDLADILREALVEAETKQKVEESPS